MVLQSLIDKRIVTWRRVADEYRVWQGSELNIELEIEKNLDSGPVSLAEQLNSVIIPSPIVAQRHSYNTGTLRYFVVKFADEHTSF